MIKISVIIPIYNAINTINKAIDSVVNQTIGFNNLELIIVDDCSTDGSYQYLRTNFQEYNNVKIIQLPSNSGSPSTPRNVGIDNSDADYIMFLDADDSLPLNVCEILYEEIIKSNLDHVRGKIEVFNGKNSFVANDLKKNYEGREAIKKIMSKQSTIMYGIFSKKYFSQDKVRFLPDVKMGEDTIVLTHFFSYTQKVKYINEITYYYFKNDKIDSLSSTQSYEAKDVFDHLKVWTESEKNLQKIGLSYYKLRLTIAVKVTLENLIKYNNFLDEDCFNKLSLFLIENSEFIDNSIFNQRISDLYDTLIEKNFADFKVKKKKRLLINGYDLKFTKEIAECLSDKYEILFDEWTGHNKHDERKSRKLLEWADIIWCEWMLGNAVWYTKYKKTYQVLFIRMHRFEITRDFYKDVEHSNVDFYTTVGSYFYEKFIEVMNINRRKCYMIPNAINFEAYSKNKEPNFRKNIALVGSLPKRKGLDKAIEILKNLPQDYQLYILGKKYTELNWIISNKEEFNYYENVEKTITENNLDHRVHYLGWVNTKEALKNIGYVLSVSDDEEYPESFHLAPLEGLASGALCCCLNWRGVEYVYPNELIMNSTDEISEFIIKTSTDEILYQEMIHRNYKKCKQLYDLKIVGEKFDKLINLYSRIK